MSIVLKENFVLFRLPDDNNIQLWLVSKNDSQNTYFTFHSFDNQRNVKLFPIKKLNLKKEEIHGLSFDIQYKKSTWGTQRFSKENYLKTCHFFIENLKQHRFQKLIFSRIKFVEKIKNLNEKFLQLCEKYPTAFVYLTHFDGETWLGASPERLLQIENRSLKTVALAGTKAVAEPRNWTEKEQKEHQLVVDYIADSLHDFPLEIGETHTIQLGEIQHLKTSILADLPTNPNVQNIIQKLHPTPAVCGIPKAEAMKFILQNEGYDRCFYTGYFGLVSPEKTDIFVNLRCAQLYENHTAIYVGGGLLAESIAENEWDETMWKAQALTS